MPDDGPRDAQDGVTALRPLADSLPIQLLAAHDRVMRYFRPMLHRFGMTDQQWRVLRVIAAAGEADFRAVGEACLIRPASLSRMLEGLEARGWVVRRVNGQDRRQRLVALTDAGRAVFEAASAETERIHRALEADLGPAYGRALAALEEIGARIGAGEG